MKRDLWAVIGCAGLMMIVSPSAKAALLCLPVLPPGGVLLPNTDDTCPADYSGTSPIGTLVSDTGVQAFSFTGSGVTTAGNLQEVVYRELGGTLDFYLQVQVTSGVLDSAISGLNTGNFGGPPPFVTQVGTTSLIQLLGAGTVAPYYDTRSAQGSTIQWNYLNGVTAGSTSFTMAISTDALFDAPGNIALIGSGGTATLAGFQPVRTPEPKLEVYIVLGATLGLAALFIRRRYAQDALTT
jgi:hypothetical protein